MKLKVWILFIAFCSCLNIQAKGFNASADNMIIGDDYPSSHNYKKLDNGSIVVDTIVENLSLAANDIYLVAKNYIENAYKDTKYKIVTDDRDKCSVAGQGSLENFFDYQLGFNQYFLNMEFTLRIDAKEGRTRVALLVDKYSGKCINGNSTKDVDDRISDFMPVNQNNMNKKIMYTKAFPELMRRLHRIMRDAVGDIKSKCGTAVGNENW